ncbi:hypothetical protein [Natrialbaceae archaeon AArc-T1-2]|uniref:hypothetical protein n=1 Tax=Natrialbaceae archaeon AArc-T1-2 TaxID=3053904 RepID=UPI00255A7911|nr:hypothetical protein [Natrialbaceae archaeon AArc-T1-2]WIV67048.1 hypothetical protein QQ977_15390 [Natrialbaceae archaeon AArc-T1-2]
MTDEPARSRRTSDPFEQSERILEATGGTIDAHEQLLASWRASLEAQRTLLGAWTTAIGGRQVDRERTTDSDHEPVTRTVDYDGGTEQATPATADRLYALERRQDALERKVDRILDAIEESERP